MTTANTKTQAESFTGNLFLIGFMGSGKSTIAAELSSAGTGTHQSDRLF